jgi:hypothetical protein
MAAGRNTCRTCRISGAWGDFTGFLRASGRFEIRNHYVTGLAAAVQRQRKPNLTDTIGPIACVVEIVLKHFTIGSSQYDRNSRLVGRLKDPHHCA